MELLAPAGNLESFQAALDHGADAVYVGAPGVNARNLARDLSLVEIAVMIGRCRELGRKFYLAANSLVREEELFSVLQTLGQLEALAPDGLIVQDLGLARLIRNYFPALPLHASTLMAAHSVESVRYLAGQGFERVVLARELTLAEIDRICAQTEVEIEIFVHGAMCFSFSGLCLFSSSLGGKSGLRGRCVQPCRRLYAWQKRSGGGKTGAGGKGGSRGGNTGGGKGAGQGYLFSMNDLEGLEAVPGLRASGVASLKIEGRLRPANYVAQVVRAYRLVMDCQEQDMKPALAEARHLIERAMSRKTASGYFFSPQPAEAITPHHSGNMGLHLGRMGSVRQRGEQFWGKVQLKEDLMVGDRLRLHIESTGDRHAFTLKEMEVESRPVQEARAGSPAFLGLPGVVGQAGTSGPIEVYQVDVATTRQVSVSKAERTAADELLARAGHDLAPRLGMIRAEVCARTSEAEVVPETVLGKSQKRPFRAKGRPQPHKSFELWLRMDSTQLLKQQLPFTVGRYLLNLTRQNVARSGEIKRQMGAEVRKIVWCLPPIIFDQEFGRVRKQVQVLIRSGFRLFQLGHISQARLFHREKVSLSTDYTVSVLNSQSAAWVQGQGVGEVQLSIESDRAALTTMVQGVRAVCPGLRLGLTVYGAPPLFLARVSAPHFQFGRSFESPKGERYHLERRDSLTAALSERPFSLLPYTAELVGLGLQYLVVDLCGLATGRKEIEELAARVKNSGHFARLPTFNYLGLLQ